MFDDLHTCCFTGHRAQKLPFGFDENHPACVRIKEELKAHILEAAHDGYTRFISGGALGVDLWAARAVLELKEDYRWLELEMAIPCADQPDRWGCRHKAAYRDICGRADEVTMVSADAYYNGCMQKRNRYMVDKSSRVIAVYDGSPGGTAFTLAYARRMGKDVKIINI